MNGESAYYCVIQYCPDRGRAESANVGVMLYAPASSRVRAKVAELSPRARRFFAITADQAAAPDAAARALAHLINSGAAMIDSTEALAAFIATRANDVGLTTPRLVKMKDFETELEQLFRELVHAASANPMAVSPHPQPLLSPKLSDVFTRLSLAGRVKSPGKILVPVLARELDIPYAYRNGVLNLVKPQVFVSGKRSENTAVQLAAEGQLLRKHSEAGERRLIVVAGAGSTPQAEDRAARLFGELGVRLIPQTEVDAFAAEVEEQAH